jgi:hypothetical protein
MNRSRQAHLRLAIFLAGLLAVFPLFAEDANNLSATTNNPPLVAHGNSPVDVFRQLLAMTPDERDKFLVIYPTEIRTRILAKVDDYEAMDPNERALRLRATELRWYLMPLLRDAPTNRAAPLAQMPDDIRDLVESRLTEWTILPPQLKQEFLDNEHILRSFADVDTTNSTTGGAVAELSGDERARWNSLSEIERQQVAAGFNQFFSLNAEEKQKTLNTLSEAERQQMEKTLQTFESMPATQRAECVNAFTKFAGMSAMEKAEFLKNAERWSEMSPAERQAWRDLVVNVPQWPPLPIGFMPPAPPDTSPAVATNHH